MDTGRHYYSSFIIAGCVIETVGMCRKFIYLLRRLLLADYDPIPDGGNHG